MTPLFILAELPNTTIDTSVEDLNASQEAPPASPTPKQSPTKEVPPTLRTRHQQRQTDVKKPQPAPVSGASNPVVAPTPPVAAVPEVTKPAAPAPTPQQSPPKPVKISSPVKVPEVSVKVEEVPQGNPDMDDEDE